MFCDFPLGVDFVPLALEVRLELFLQVRAERTGRALELEVSELRLQVGDLGVRADQSRLEVQRVELVGRVFFVVFAGFLLLRLRLLVFLVFG